MKFYITYFYNVRFLCADTIPISTAKWDPKWFHANSGNQDVMFTDDRGVFNGIRMPELSPYKLTHVECCKNCQKNPKTCNFLKDYSNYLHTLDFQNIYTRLTSLSKKLKEVRHLEYDPSICLLVHEKPDNPCSERQPLINWFKENGVELQELEV